MPIWYFERPHAMGGASGESFTNTLLGSGSIESLLAREAIQNSCDAQFPHGVKVQVSFRLARLSGAMKTKFLSTCDFVGPFSARASSLGLTSGSVLDHAEDPDRVLDLLYIEDFKTSGLLGDPHSQKSNFNRLLLTIGDAGKTRGDEGSGGSYGFGKAVYSTASRIRTIFVFTEIDPANESDGVGARLLGCSYFRAHDFEDTAYTGRAWYGVGTETEGILDPLTDEQARQMAVVLGFARQPGQFGTSILVVDCLVDLEQLNRETELWWWPRIVEDDLDVVISAPDGHRVFPRPRRRPELQPFIGCYDLVVGRAQPAAYQRTKALNRLGELELGVYGFTSLDDERAQALNEALVTLSGSTPTSLVSRVALIRTPRMVVAYEQLARSSSPCVGAFVADVAVNNFLRFSEPPEHNRWDKDSPRLEQAGPQARAAVDAVLKRLVRLFRDFQAEIGPRVPEGKKLRFMEKLLAEYLVPSTEPGGTGATQAGPVHITFTDTSVVSQGAGLAARATFRVRLKDEEPSEQMALQVRVRAPLIEDGATEGEEVNVTITSDTHFLEFENGSTAFARFGLTKGETAGFSSATDAYDPGWTTKIIVEISPVPGGQGE